MAPDARLGRDVSHVVARKSMYCLPLVKPPHAPVFWADAHITLPLLTSKNVRNLSYTEAYVQSLIELT